MTQPATVNRVDKSSAVNLRLTHHLSYSQIAAIQGVSPQAIHSAIKDLLPIPETKVWQDHRADILANIQLKLLSNIDPERLKKAPVGSLVLAACQLYDKERLERGEATHIMAYDAPALRDRYAELRQLLQDTSTVIEVVAPGNIPLLDRSDNKSV